MPLYDLTCTEGHASEEMIPLADFDKPIAPCACGAERSRVVGRLTFWNGEIYDYVSQIDGTHITSKRAHREHLVRNKLFEIGNEIDALMQPRRDELPDMKPLISDLYESIRGKYGD